MLYILIIILSAIGSYFSTWWAIAPISFLLCAWKADTGLKAYAVSALAITTLWVAYATYLSISTGGIITGRIAELFSGNNAFLSKLPKAAFLMTAMALVGANVAGFAGVAGYHFRQLFK